MASSHGKIQIVQHDDHFSGHFTAMASPCELLIDSGDRQLAHQLVELAANEAWRIERKYSRYKDDNVMHSINHSDKVHTPIDAETWRLLTFADTCYVISDGLFDITSGILRKVWQFDGSDKVPQPSQIAALLPLIGWNKVHFNADTITLPKGFELDFGGIGKEYAVDSAAKLCQHVAADVSVLVNFGGDIQVTRPRQTQPYWQVGIEDPTGQHNTPVQVNIAKGGLATSGDARRYILNNGQRFSHILNPKTGYPISGAPRSVTVAADQCIASGLLATLALLHGQRAEEFLKAQGQSYWCFW